MKELAPNKKKPWFYGDGTFNFKKFVWELLWLHLHIATSSLGLFFLFWELWFQDARTIPITGLGGGGFGTIFWYPHNTGVYYSFTLVSAREIWQWEKCGYGAFTLDVKSALNENLGGILGGTQR